MRRSFRWSRLHRYFAWGVSCLAMSNPRLLRRSWLGTHSPSVSLSCLLSSLIGLGSMQMLLLAAGVECCCFDRLLVLITPSIGFCCCNKSCFLTTPFCCLHMRQSPKISKSYWNKTSGGGGDLGELITIELELTELRMRFSYDESDHRACRLLFGWKHRGRFLLLGWSVPVSKRLGCSGSSHRSLHLLWAVTSTHRNVHKLAWRLQVERLSLLWKYKRRDGINFLLFHALDLHLLELRQRADAQIAQTELTILGILSERVGIVANATYTVYCRQFEFEYRL